MDDIRFPEPRPRQDRDECEICGDFAYVIAAIDGDMEAVLCHPCWLDNREFRTWWDILWSE